VQAQQQSLFLSYPPDNHQTTANSIFFIGSAPPSGEVLINGKPIQLSNQGYFAPSFPLQMGENKFTITHENESITRTITKLSTKPELPQGLGFAKNSLTPQHNIARLPGELICFSAIAPPNATVSVKLGTKTITLMPSSQVMKLPANEALLILENDPINEINLQKSNVWENVQGCMNIQEEGFTGKAMFSLKANDTSIEQQSTGEITILSPNKLDVVEIVANEGIARTGPSTDYSRLTPLPKGTRASVTGKEGEWLRLDYGGWLKASETKTLPDTTPPVTLIRSINSKQENNATEIVFPLQHPVPISIKQENEKLSLTLYNITAQTDTIRFDDNPYIQRIDWHQVNPKQIEYIFNFKSQQQWGYDAHYEGTMLILSLRHPPQITNRLEGVTILLDPGHGGQELGSVGPNGYPEKDINLIISKLLQKELTERGAKVVLTRETDRYLFLEERVKLINEIKPTLALSIHYNALPDGGDAMKTQGISTYWYNPQAHDLAVFLHNYLVEKLNRPSYGVFWNNLALTRPNIAPSVLLELGFMINPDEFEWITNLDEQQKLAEAIANSITEWLLKNEQ
jgi:N-acetylmuramoyl-L-alanine amidase